MTFMKMTLASHHMEPCNPRRKALVSKHKQAASLGSYVTASSAPDTVSWAECRINLPRWCTSCLLALKDLTSHWGKAHKSGSCWMGAAGLWTPSPGVGGGHLLSREGRTSWESASLTFPAGQNQERMKSTCHCLQHCLRISWGGCSRVHPTLSLPLGSCGARLFSEDWKKENQSQINGSHEMTIVIQEVWSKSPRSLKVVNHLCAFICVAWAPFP
jgi:hypothetical protein